MHERMDRESCIVISGDGKRLKCIAEAPLVLKERLLLGKKLPTYTVNAASSSPLVSSVLREVICYLNDDIFRELFDFIRMPWDVADARVV